jgi:hypothetical protein
MSASRPNPVRMLSHALAALFNSRSAFLEQWRRYETIKPSPQGIEGRWVGEWISESNGHHGELKCVLVPVSKANYRAYFYATFAKVFRVAYATNLTLEQSDGRAALKGAEDLGPLAGGVYRCEGEVTDNKMQCRYSCKYDQGVFHLQRLD